MTDSLMPTATLIADCDRTISNLRFGGQRAELLGIRNQLRHRTTLLEGRLEKGEQWFRDHANDPSAPRQEKHWLQLEKEYRNAFDATQRATAAL